ncbi:hypothetical protein EV175_000248 [Coemansia sp. RSA 1933]|nr:hypothetical protein EV175_000248 [Coemansia sp. RSA 1933]
MTIVNSTVSLLSQWTAINSTVRARVAEAQTLQQAMSLASSSSAPRLAGIQAARLGCVIDEVLAQLLPALQGVLETHTMQQQQKSSDDSEDDDPMAVVLGLAGARARASAERAVAVCTRDMAEWRLLGKAYSLDRETGTFEFLAKAEACSCGREASVMLAEINARLEMLDQDRRARAAEQELRLMRAD